MLRCLVLRYLAALVTLVRSVEQLGRWNLLAWYCHLQNPSFILPSVKVAADASALAQVSSKVLGGFSEILFLEH